MLQNFDWTAAILSWLSIFGLSTVKYALGLIWAINSTYGTIPALIANVLGGGTGIYLFTKFEIYFKHRYMMWKYGPDNHPKKFTKRNRKLVKFKSRFGMVGIAIFTPIVLSIPVGVILALALTDNKKKIFFYIFASCIFWTAITYGAYHFMDLNLMGYFRKMK